MRHQWSSVTFALLGAIAGCNQILGNQEHGVEQNSTNPTGDDASDSAPLPDATIDSTSPPPNGAHDAAAGDALADGGDGAVGTTAPEASTPPACTPGGDCTPGDCASGTWACDGGARVCETTSLFDAGTPCGGDDGGGAHVCSAGQCVACNAGADCSDPAAPCVKKTIDCSSGSPQCVASGNVTDGHACGSGGLLFCNGGVCSACEVGAPCSPAANACHIGKVTACTGGTPTCTDQGTAASAGTACTAAGGASGVCDGAGSCAACSPNAQCNPGGNACQVGVQSCAMGAQCTAPSNVREGQTCGAAGTGDICHAGACVACSATSCPGGCCDPVKGCIEPVNQSVSECGNGTAGGVCLACPAPSAGTGTGVCNGANACTISCTGATSLSCAGACVDPTKDPNCGICGRSCSSTGMVCSAGQCGCASGLTSCNAGCTNLQTDSTNCGACGKACTAGASCVAGACGCAPGMTMCNGACVNEQADSNNCGECQRQCSAEGAGFACVQGTCTCGPSTPDGTVCNGSISDVCINGRCLGALAASCSSSADCIPGGCADGICLGSLGVSGVVSCGDSALSCRIPQGCSFPDASLGSNQPPVCGDAAGNSHFVGCDGPNDCGPDQDCCFFGQIGASMSQCMSRTTPGVIGSGCVNPAGGTSQLVVCDLNNPIATCPTGTSCTDMVGGPLQEGALCF